MNDTTTTPTDTPEDGTSGRAGVGFDAPEDVAEDDSKGYAVYDRTIGQYVGPVAATKAKAESAATKTKGHRHATVRV